MNQNRRAFLKNSAALTAGSILSSPANLLNNMNNGYELIVLATNWGFAGTTEEFCAAAKKEGYDGIEIWWPGDDKGRQELFAALKKYRLQVGFLCAGNGTDPVAHLESFKRSTTAAATNSHQAPLYVNCHSGKDFFSFEQSVPFIEHTVQLAKSSGIPVLHETHRGRIMYAAPVAKQHMQKNSALRLTLDISHWCNVHESMLEDQNDTVQQALDRTDHIHARVGHPEGPQVNDPRAPEWKDITETHFKWWDKIYDRKKKNGQKMTFLTEFGPVHYMPALPYTVQPLSDQWAINVHMMKLLRERYGK